MENKKVVITTIIISLCIFLPLTIIGFIFKGDRNLLDENPKHEMYYKNNIWFYDDNDNFLSKYECRTEICEISTPTIDDDAYNINYYKNTDVKKVEIVDEIHTFITDGSLIYLYNVTNGKTLNGYKSLKNYNTKIENDIYILQNEEDLWGVLTIGDSLNKVLDFEYDFIGLLNNVTEDGILKADKFIVQKDNKWFIVDNTNNIITGYIEDPIVDYTNDYIISKNGDKVRIFSYDNFEYLNMYNIKDYIIYEDYIGIITDNFLLVYNNLSENYIKSITMENTNDKVSLEKENNSLNIKINGSLVDSIELN